jgi:hypothetical protein
MKDIVCPKCKKSVLTVGFYHESDSTMKCCNCNGVVFPTTKPLEDKSRTELQALAVNWNLKRELLPIKIGAGTTPGCKLSETFIG